jgi:hypothetical protein
MKINDLSKKTSGDYAVAAAKSILGALPVLGSTAAEIFGLIVTPPLEKRKIQWMNEIAERLAELEKSKEINIAELANNELFIDVVMQASSLAIKTSQNEKLEAFKNAILNTAVNSSISDAKAHIFLSQLDKFTDWHVKIIVLLENPENWFRKANRTFPAYIALSLSNIIKEAYPELKDEDSFLDIIWNDLKVAGFHNSGDLKTTMSGNGLATKKTTKLGDEFLNYIRFEQK